MKDKMVKPLTSPARGKFGSMAKTLEKACSASSVLLCLSYSMPMPNHRLGSVRFGIKETAFLYALCAL